MKKSGEQSRARGWFGSRMFLTVAIAVAFFLLAANVRTYYRDYEIWQEIRALEQQKNELQKKKLESMDLLSYVMSDHFVEDSARTQLGLKKPGEHVLVVATSPSRIVDGDRPESQTRQRMKNPVKWWYYFFSREGIGREVE